MSRATRCPICKQPSEPPFKPFCSKRCADIDLGRWMTGGYVVPGRDSDTDSEDDSARQTPKPGGAEGEGD
jgi:endogenous inhibitor of DNA gyrase (YacG/DUF329 family)